MMCSRCKTSFYSEHYKTCDRCREADRKWTAANPEKRQEARRKWQEANPEKYRESRRKYEEANRDHILEQQRRYREENPEKARKSERKWREANREKCSESVRKWQKDNPEKVRCIHHKRRARIIGNGGSYTLNELNALFEAQNGLCYYCGRLLFESFETSFHIEHKIPLARGGSNNIENIALSCAKCNLTKGPMTHEEFLKKEELKNDNTAG